MPKRRTQGPIRKVADSHSSPEYVSDRRSVGEAESTDGDAVPLKKKSKKAKAKKGAELNLFGDFPRPSTWDDAKERKLIQAKKNLWFPHELDFRGCGRQQLTGHLGLGFFAQDCPSEVAHQPAELLFSWQ